MNDRDKPKEVKLHELQGIAFLVAETRIAQMPYGEYRCYIGGQKVRVTK